jgi:hypothetical protein
MKKQQFAFLGLVVLCAALGFALELGITAILIHS